MKITLCGSAKFERDFKIWDETLTLAGHTVYSLAVYPSDKSGEKNWYTPLQKVALDAAHLRKIDNSEAILVLNVNGYIGDSTRREIAYAASLGKEIYLSSAAGSEPIRRFAREYGCDFVRIICNYNVCPNPLSHRRPCVVCYE